MNQPLNKKGIILGVIETLSSSKLFSEDKIYVDILQYLAKEEKNIKATTLANEIFGENSDEYTDVHDSRIRNKVFKLRKKLELYYLTEGREDSYKINIPKGKYQLELTVQKKKSNTPPSNNTRQLLRSPSTYIICVLVLLVAFLLILLGQKENSNLAKKKSLVSVFLSKEKALNVVVGSRHFYREYDPQLKRIRYILDTDKEIPYFKIKMDAFVASYPERRVAITSNLRFTEIQNMQFAADLKSEWNISNSSCQISESILIAGINSIKENTVFIDKVGDGNLFYFAELFKGSRFLFDKRKQNMYGEIVRFQVKKDSSFFLKYKKEKYFLIKKKRLKNGRYVLFMLGSDRYARNYIHEHLFDNDFSNSIISSFPKRDELPQEFEMLIEIEKNSHHLVLYNSARDGG